MSNNDTTNPDTWIPRDYPVLVAAAKRLNEKPGRAFTAHELARDLPLDVEEVKRALVALMPDYLTGQIERSGADEVDIAVTGMSSEGRREAGLWPKKADHLESLIAALEAAAERTDDAEDRSTLRSIGDGLKAVPGSVASGLLTAWLASQGGI